MLKILLISNFGDEMTISIQEALQLRGLRFLLEKHDPQGALGNIRKSTPTLILLHVRPDTVDTFQLLKSIHDRHANLPAIIISTRQDPAYAMRSLRAGARAFLHQNEIRSCLGEAVQLVAAGEQYVSESIMQGILHGMNAAGDIDHQLLETLSDREFVVFQFVGQGLTLRKIADEMHLSAKTVSTHLTNIKRKLHLANTGQLLHLASLWTTGSEPSQPLAREFPRC